MAENSSQIATDIKAKFANQEGKRRGESVVFTFPFQTYGNHATRLSTSGHVISERHWKDTFSFTEIISNFGSKQRTECQIV